MPPVFFFCVCAYVHNVKKKWWFKSQTGHLFVTAEETRWNDKWGRKTFLFLLCLFEWRQNTFEVYFLDDKFRKEKYVTIVPQFFSFFYFNVFFFLINLKSFTFSGFRHERIKTYLETCNRVLESFPPALVCFVNSFLNTRTSFRQQQQKNCFVKMLCNFSFRVCLSLYFTTWQRCVFRRALKYNE